MKITVGADPELFIIDKTTGKVVSAVGLIPGTKAKPYKIKKGYAIETDNILAEFNIPPAKDCDEFVESIEFMKDYLATFIGEINPDYGIRCASSAMVDDDQLQSDEAKMIGCDVDYNVYTQEPNEKKTSYPDNRRVAGFHIHIGYQHPTIDASLRLVKYLDMWLGVPSVMYDDDKVRRSLYGRAGSFRLTPYGLEYRSLGGGMLRSSDLVRFVYKQVGKAVLSWLTAEDLADSVDVRKAINDSDTETCRSLCVEYDLV